MKELLSKKRAKLAELDEGWADSETRKSRIRDISDWLRSEHAEVPDNLADVLENTPIDPGWMAALYKGAKASKAMRSAKEGVPQKVGSAKLRRSALNRGEKASNARLSEIIKRAKESSNRQVKQDAAAAILTNALQPKAR